MAKGGAMIACLQERDLFEELADEIQAEIPVFIDIRDRAGWSDEAPKSTPKMAALIADSLLEKPAEKLFDITSEGRCLILGSPETTLPVAEQLADILAVTILLEGEEDAPVDRRFDLVVGRLKTATGTLGNFHLRIDALQQLDPTGRGPFQMTPPRDGAETECDIILDLRGETPLFPAPNKRDGYLRADPRNPAAVAKAVFDASQMVGTFEKPFYLKTESHLCAHSRAEITGCSKCLDICPTGAIFPDGEHVTVDPAICGGCGSCVALCPSGALTYDAPPTDITFKRLQTLADAYRNAGGKSPRLLVHDGEYGGEMISLAARFGRGLPADVIPIEVAALSGFGHAEMLAALACGFSKINILMTPKTEPETLTREQALALAIAGEPRITLLDLADPDALSDALYGAAPAPLVDTPILPLGSRRQIARLSATALRPDTGAPIPLPEHAPYGAVVVDTDACTLCLSCVSQCPTGALGDNPDKPQLRFQEDACLQCGLCTRVCPEKAITLNPQFNLSDQAFTQTVVHEEDPFECISCGKPFGVKSTIEKVMEKLAGKHPMFATTDAGKLIQMCDTCRIEAQYHSENSPFQGGERPRVVTTEDYLSKRRDH
jgi:ferredoxin